MSPPGFLLFREGRATSTNWTAAQLAALDAVIATAIASGAKVVEYGDRRVERYSIDEILKLRAVMAQSVASAAGTSSTRYAAHDKGLSR